MNKFLTAAMEQSARDVGCRASDFLKPENTFTVSGPRPGKKVFYSDRVDFLAVSYGRGSVITVCPDKFEEAVSALGGSKPILPEDFIAIGLSPAFESIFFLPHEDDIEPLPCRFETRFLSRDDFKDLYLPEWSNALCEKRPQYDKIAVGAYDGGRLIGLAGASQDAENMLQIGIDVLPEYRKNGVAASLTSRLAHEIIKTGQVPFYSCRWNNIPSFRNALKAGFRPVWTETEAKILK